MEEKKSLNILKLILKILYRIFIAFCVVLILVIAVQNFTNSGQSIGGYRIFHIVSGSMSPKYDSGEVVISKEIDVNEIKVGDDIVYVGSIGDIKNRVILHEVIEIEHNEQGKIVIHAKGIANNENDPDVREEQILGIVKFKSTILAYLFVLATNQYTSFIVIFILVMNVFISFKMGAHRNEYLPAGKEIPNDEESEKEEEDEDEETIDTELENNDEIDIEENEFDNEDIKINTKKKKNEIENTENEDIEEENVVIKKKKSTKKDKKELEDIENEDEKEVKNMILQNNKISKEESEDIEEDKKIEQKKKTNTKRRTKKVETENNDIT